MTLTLADTLIGPTGTPLTGTISLLPLTLPLLLDVGRGLGAVIPPYPSAVLSGGAFSFAVYKPSQCLPQTALFRLILPDRSTLSGRFPERDGSVTLEQLGWTSP